MRIELVSLTAAASVAVLVGHATARAQGEPAPAATTGGAAEGEVDAAPPAAAAAPSVAQPEPSPEVGADPSLAPESEAPAASAPVTDAPPEDATEEKPPVPGWFRLDSDGYGLQAWVGATHSLGPIDIASDIYVGSGAGASGFSPFAELDLGPSFTIGLGGDNSLIVTPMAGIVFDWSQKRATSLVAPQLYLYLTLGPIYFESWTQTFVNSVFTEGANNDLYLRDFLLFKLTDHLAIGPHMEATLALNNDRDTLASLPVQGAVSLNYGHNNTLLLALGYETQEAARQVVVGTETDAEGNELDVVRERGVAGRFTFTRLW